LSGGERNRLLLARLLTRPANTLVLDEPPNDLDLEPLELLEQQLVDWPGTLLLVSHDRRFLDNVVTSTIAFEGGGKVEESVGGYEDYLRQRPAAVAPAAGARAAVDKPAQKPAVKKKRSFKEEREYGELPGRIAALEEEQKQLQASLADSEFYKKGGAVIQQAVDRVAQIDEELLTAMERWDVLDSIGTS
ncbi:MAG: ABC transporter ATP-binding protein, partial [Acidimicrobiia bacterium]